MGQAVTSAAMILLDILQLLGELQASVFIHDVAKTQRACRTHRSILLTLHVREDTTWTCQGIWAGKSSADVAEVHHQACRAGSTPNNESAPCSTGRVWKELIPSFRLMESWCNMWVPKTGHCTVQAASLHLNAAFAAGSNRVRATHTLLYRRMVWQGYFLSSV